MFASDEDGVASAALKFSLASEIVELVVLTGDAIFLQTLREAVGSARRLWHVPSGDQVSDLLVAGEVGILVLDVAALIGAADVFVGQIKRQFPDLVVIVAGSRDDESALAALISAGVVYRFIHKPMSPNRARLFVDAAVKRHGEQRRAAPPVDQPSRRLPAWWLGMGVLMIIGAAAAAMWLTHGGSAALAPADADHGASSSSSSELLNRAAGALAANELTQPAGANALELYLQATARAPADPAARAGLAEVRERLLARAENALLEERLDEAAIAIETARLSGVESGRIAFLGAQLAKSRERLKAAQAAHPRSEAKVSTASVPAPDPVQVLVNLAVERLDSRQLVEPEHDNARYYLNEALRASPTNEAALEVKKSLARTLLTQARVAIDGRDFGHAAEWLDAAEGMAAPADLETSRALLAGSRAQADSDARLQLLTHAHQSLLEDHLIEPANDNAKYYLLTVRGLSPDTPGLSAMLQDLGTRLVGKARLAMTLQQYDAARSWLDEAAAIGFYSADGNSVQHDLQAALAQQAFLADIVPASQLTLVKSVPPQYPSKAAASRTEGWVEVDFTVETSGQVSNLSVHGASPPGVFEEAALKAVAQWRYRPVLRKDAPAAVRSRLRIRFAAP